MLKKIEVIFIVIILLIIIRSNTCVFAEEDNSYIINKTVTPYSYTSEEGGEIILDISNINLNNNSSYKYKLKYNELETQWYNITNVDTDKNKLRITLEKDKSDILSILKMSDEAYLTVQEETSDKKINIIDNKIVDISLPLSKAFKVDNFISDYYEITNTYNIEEIYYRYIKLDNEEMLKKCLKYIEEYNKNESAYSEDCMDNFIDQLNIEDEMPRIGWEKLKSSSQVDIHSRENELYFIWIKAPKTDSNKELIGCVFSKKFTYQTELEKKLKEQLEEVQEKNKELTATVSYDPTSKTIGYVTVTIKTNKKVGALNGWAMANDGTTLIKTFSQNATETEHLVDKYGKSKDVVVTVKNITSEIPDNNKKMRRTVSLLKVGVDIMIIFIILIMILIICVTINTKKKK